MVDSQTELKGIARLRLDDGKLEDFKRLSAECIEIMRVKDTGTLQYEIYLNADETECVLYGALQQFRRVD